MKKTFYVEFWKEGSAKSHKSNRDFDFFVNVAYKNSRRFEGTILILLCINSNDISVHWKYKHWNWRQTKA